MKQSEFEKLLTEAGLHPWQASRSYGIAYSVVLYAATEWGIRYQCDWLAYEPAEFAAMTLVRAEAQIALLKKKLERAAKTKQGVLR